MKLEYVGYNTAAQVEPEVAQAQRRGELEELDTYEPSMVHK
jgi:hypothetical protein